MFQISAENLEQIQCVVHQFYSAFDSRTRTPDLSQLLPLFLPFAKVHCKSQAHTQSFSVDEFLKPRQVAFDQKCIEQFFECEVESDTIGDNNQAVRMSRFHKQGTINKQYSQRIEAKSFQLLNSESGWKIASITWCKE